MTIVLDYAFVLTVDALGLSRVLKEAIVIYTGEDPLAPWLRYDSCSMLTRTRVDSV